MVERIGTIFKFIYYLGLSIVVGIVNALLLYYPAKWLIEFSAPKAYELFMAGILETDFYLTVALTIVLTGIVLFLLRNIYGCFWLVYLKFMDIFE